MKSTMEGQKTPSHVRVSIDQACWRIDVSLRADLQFLLLGWTGQRCPRYGTGGGSLFHFCCCSGSGLSLGSSLGQRIHLCAWPHFCGCSWLSPLCPGWGCGVAFPLRSLVGCLFPGPFTEESRYFCWFVLSLAFTDSRASFAGAQFGICEKWKLRELRAVMPSLALYFSEFWVHLWLYVELFTGYLDVFRGKEPAKVSLGHLVNHKLFK